MFTPIRTSDALSTFAARIDLAVEVIDDGRGGYVTRSTRDGLSGIRLGTTERLRAAIHTALDAHLAGHGWPPSLPDRCQTAAQRSRHIGRAVRGLLEQDFAARY